jgi:hypothetical protein
MFDAAHDPGQKLNQFRLRREGMGLLDDWHLPQPVQQSVLSQELPKGDEHPTECAFVTLGVQTPRL